MLRLRFWMLLLGTLLCVPAPFVSAHGGSYRGPPGGVPPGLRPPGDPEPPPPPPSNGDDTGGPTSGPDGTPAPDPGIPDSGGGDGPQPGPNPTPPTGRGGPATKKPLTYESWRFWWGYNKAPILNLKDHIYSTGPSSVSALAHGGFNRENRRNVLRPTRRAIELAILPALLRTINRKGDHEDIHGGAMVAVGKIGGVRHLSMLEAALFNRYKNDRGQKMDFGYQATESAVLALGLLPNADETTRKAIREICLRALQDKSLRTRERSWAAIAIGLQRDTGATRALMMEFGKKHANHNVPAAILAAVGLTGDTQYLDTMVSILNTGRYNRANVPDRVRAFAGYAITKMGDPRVLPELMKTVRSRSMRKVIKRSAAIAIGVLGQATDDEDVKKESVRALQHYIRNAKDASGENFAIIALSQIGTPDAIATLLRIAKDGRYSQRPFAALGLGTYVWYATKNDSIERETRSKIVKTLTKLSDKYKDADTKAAFLLARGLAKDKTAVPTLTALASKRSANPLARAFACEALGLIGVSNREVKESLTMALKERRSVILRRSAATGLSLLHDSNVLPLLLEELRRAKSFTVQSQLIQAIGTIGDQKAIAPLVNLLDDTNEQPQTRAMAAVGLGMIGDLEKLPRLAELSHNYNYRASVPDIDELLYIL